MDLHLETDRLLLRLPEGRDAQTLFEIYSDPEVIRHVVSPGEPSLARAWRHVAMVLGHWQLRHYGSWGVVEKASEALIGMVGLSHPEGSPGCELGWMIRRERWGQGFATEASRAALEWTWMHTSQRRVISLIQPANLPSVRIAEKLQMLPRRTLVLSGVDHYEYRIDRT